ncbi:hypothetical protein V495_00284 [Pseudogymnoascus sp. VKM F-4514 (FW-929)]|nr:hypothetical protein V495_00284 [Pseudogymnoascus sp. VKM F-4514 (FW-929)]KFY67763.1 hypothetical protein V497_00227 [Pseudogymnoascus sp. VKM F-4516 (FW-969)]
MIFKKLLLALFAARSIEAGRDSKRAHFDWDKTDFVLAFGDSYTFVQGTEGNKDFSFLGDNLNLSYTREKLYGDKIVKNQTSAGGPNWTEYLTGCYEGFPWKCKRPLWNFAFAGSDISVEYTPLHHDFTVEFVKQIDQYDKYGDKHLPKNRKNALVAIWIGINDISDSSKYALNVTGVNYTSIYTKMINTQFKAMETLQADGYHNYLVMGQPPRDRTPDGLVSEHPLPNKTMFANWDHILASTARKFEEKHRESNVFVFDTYSYLSDVLDNSEKHHFTNITAFCADYAAPDIIWNYANYGCEPIYNYFWLNSGHITYHAHEILAKGVASFLRRMKR